MKNEKCYKFVLSAILTLAIIFSGLGNIAYAGNNSVHEHKPLGGYAVERIISQDVVGTFTWTDASGSWIEYEYQVLAWKYQPCYCGFRMNYKQEGYRYKAVYRN